MARSTRTSKKTSDGDSIKAESAPRTRRASGRATVTRDTRQNGSKSKKNELETDAEVSEDGSDAYTQDEEDDDVVSLNSDTLDDPDFDASGRKRKRVSISKSSSAKKTRSSTGSSEKKKRVKAVDVDGEFEDGVEVVGTVIQAPKTGRVPPGQISQNTLNFLKQLQNPDYNDRTWFKLHEPVYRLAEKEWKAFIEEFTVQLTEADPQIPPLPPNDVVHRIYRDIRFSNNKTPYKTNFSASFSRSGRKGIFAGFKPGDSLFAAGVWCPEKNELQTIRNNILRSSRPLRQVISDPAFVGLFGEPKPGPKGSRCNIFGRDDELKTAPKGVDKAHKDIDLLKCRSFCVILNFTDEEVLDPNFTETVKRVIMITRPFVHCLNDMMTIPPDDDESGSGSENEDEE